MITPYYQDELVTLYHGDALDIMPEIESVDLVVTDPPYFQPAQHYVEPRGERRVRTLGDTSVLEHAYKSWSTEIERMLALTGSAYLFCDGQSYSITFRAFYPVGRVRPLIWDKKTSFNGYTWRHQHEMIAWVERPEAKRVPTGEGDILSCRAVAVGKRDHPAEKPLELVSRLIEKHDDTTCVLDPFTGGGTTLVAARQLGVRSIGIEIEERYCEIAATRISGTTVSQGAFAAV